MRAVDPGLNTLVSAGMQLGAGVTSLIDMLSSRASTQQFADTVACSLQAYDHAGMRVAFAPTRFDLHATAAELAAQLRSARFPVENQQAVQAVLPHLRAWYADWEKPGLDPWIVYGSER